MPKTGRPKSKPSKKRSRKISVLFTPAEYKNLRERNLTSSETIREYLFTDVLHPQVENITMK